MVPRDIAQEIMTSSRKGKEWIVRRDEAILKGIKAGGSQREVAKLAGLTQPAISLIVNKALSVDSE